MSVVVAVSEKVEEVLSVYCRDNGVRGVVDDIVDCNSTVVVCRGVPVVMVCVHVSGDDIVVFVEK